MRIEARVYKKVWIVYNKIYCNLDISKQFRRVQESQVRFDKFDFQREISILLAPLGTKNLFTYF